MIATLRSSKVSRFFRGRVKKSKTRYVNTNYPKMNHFVATKFCIYFSGNPPNVTGDSIFPTQKTLQKYFKVMKIAHVELLRWPFIDRDQASRRVHKIMQNDAKMHHKSPRNEHEKNTNSDRAIATNARRRPTSKLASKRVHFCRSRCCFAHAMYRKNTQNRWES